MKNTVWIVLDELYGISLCGVYSDREKAVAEVNQTLIARGYSDDDYEVIDDADYYGIEGEMTAVEWTVH